MAQVVTLGAKRTLNRLYGYKSSMDLYKRAAHRAERREIHNILSNVALFPGYEVEIPTKPRLTDWDTD